MEGKLCALIRQTWYEAAVRNLSDAERLMFYETCFRYEFTGEEPTRKSCPYSTVLLMFDMVRMDLTADAEKARKIAERNRVNGALGGRPVGSNKRQPEETNPPKPTKTQAKPMGYFGSSLHNTTQQNTTQQNTTQQAAAEGFLNGDFFDTAIWPKLDPENKYKSRHRACLAMWLKFSPIKRSAITKEVQQDLFVGGANPYFYLQDFAEPTPKWLTGREVEREWSEGRVVYQVKYDEKYRICSEETLKMFGLTPSSTMEPSQ